MNAQDAKLIAAWHYEAPYDFYDMTQDQEDLEELLNPQSWKDVYYAVDNKHEELIGFFTFKQEHNTVEVGLGLRPDLTGQGFGLVFVQTGLAFAREKFAPIRFSLSVATFNMRAIRIYERAGFKPLKSFLQQKNGGEFAFLHMIKQVEGE